MEQVNFAGLILGLATFLIIGVFHPIVIKAHYYFGVKCWWCFAILGVAFGALSLFIEDVIWSAVVGVVACSCFWSILEVFEQRQRVRKGWFPKNPNRPEE